MHDHHSLVIALLDADPISPEAAKLRTEIVRLERNDPTLSAQRLVIFAAHVRKIGEPLPAEARPEGVMLT